MYHRHSNKKHIHTASARLQDRFYCRVSRITNTVLLQRSHIITTAIMPHMSGRRIK